MEWSGSIEKLLSSYQTTRHHILRHRQNGSSALKIPTRIVSLFSDAIMHLVGHVKGRTVDGVFGSGVLRRICAPKGEKATGDWRTFRNGVIHTPYTSTDKFRVLNLRTIRRAECETPTGRWEKYFPFLSENSKGSLGISERIILKCNLQQEGWKNLIGLIWLKMGNSERNLWSR